MRLKEWWETHGGGVIFGLIIIVLSTALFLIIIFDAEEKRDRYSSCWDSSNQTECDTYRCRADAYAGAPGAWDYYDRWQRCELLKGVRR